MGGFYRKRWKGSMFHEGSHGRRPLVSVSRFDTRKWRTQRQQQYVRENGCERSVECLLFAVVLWVFSVFLSLTRSLQPEKTPRTTANSRHTTLRAQSFSRTYCCWRCVRNVRVSNLDTLPLVCVWLPLPYDTKSFSADFYYGKKNWTSLLEILCFRWNYGYGIIENVAEMFWGVYSIEDASI